MEISRLSRMLISEDAFVSAYQIVMIWMEKMFFLLDI